MPDTIKNERRQDCIDHEKRLDDISSEIHKHGGWWKIIGGGLVAAGTLLGWFGNTITYKLDSIETLLSADKVAIAEMRRDISSLNTRVGNVERRHEFQDQNKFLK